MKKIRLGDYCTVSAGGDKPKVFSDTKTSECSAPVLANGIDNEGLVGFTNRASIESNSVTLSARGSTGTPFYRTKPYVPIIRLISVIPDKEYINCQYLYYLLKTRNISGTGSVQSQLTVPMVENITVPIIEDLNEQLKIATYLGNIDKKISNNNDISSQLESLAKTVYDYWFLQFDFPDENGRPYKSSGGKMVWNERLKREIPEGWKVEKVGSLAKVLTGQRDANFASPSGRYKFFTCANKTLKCDEPDFTGRAVLVAGNGDFNVKHYTGDFSAYQRTYVLMPNDEVLYGAMYMSILKNVEALKVGSSGSIIKFVTKGMVEGINVLVPSRSELCSFLNKLLFLAEQLDAENNELISLRDFLLPLLMNCQVSIDGAEANY